jgi:tRNA threonylcarbamoyladenosine biosynthesis protein TsaE
MNSVYTFDNLKTVVNQLASLVHDKKVITFTGPLGAGKTTVIRELLRLWGIERGVTSPTFTYMNQYVAADGTKIFHFDLYRLGTIDEFIALGFDEYLYQDNSIVLIEWPEIIRSLLTHSVCHIQLDYDPEDSKKRMIQVTYPPLF